MAVLHVGSAPSARTRMTRAQAAAYLTEAGFPISKSRLAKLAMNGAGPDYTIWGNRAIYERERVLSWAKSRDRSPSTPVNHLPGE